MATSTNVKSHRLGIPVPPASRTPAPVPSACRVTQGYFPPPDEALDLGWPPERIMSDCRRMPREELTPKLKMRFLAAGLTESQVKELYRHSRSWINSIRSHIAGGGQRYETSGKDVDPYEFYQTKREERCSMKFHEGVLSGQMDPRQAIIKCEPSDRTDITKEVLEKCAAAGMTAKEIAPGFRVKDSLIYNECWRQKVKLLKKPRTAKPVAPENTGDKNVSGGGTDVQPKVSPLPAAANPQPAPVAAAMAAFIGTEKYQEIAAANQAAAAHPPTPAELDEIFTRNAAPSRSTTVYLSGAIDCVDSYHAISWRDAATVALEALGVRVINPLRRGKEITAEQAVDGAMEDINDADIILVEVNDPAGGYIGTAIEIREAWRLKKPIIVWGLAFRDSKFLHYHATKTCQSLDYALGYIEGMVVGKVAAS